MKFLNGIIGLAVCMTLLSGCGGEGLDEEKSIEQVTAEAAEMSREKLQKMVDQYKRAVAERQADVEALHTKLKELSISDLMGEKAKALKTKLSDLTTSLNTLKDHLTVYTEQVKSAE